MNYNNDQMDFDILTAIMLLAYRTETIIGTSTCQEIEKLLNKHRVPIESRLIDKRDGHICPKCGELKRDFDYYTDCNDCYYELFEQMREKYVRNR